MSLFKRRRFPVEIILLCVRWYCKYGISYRDLAEIMQERGVEVDPSTFFAGSSATPQRSRSGSAGTKVIDLAPCALTRHTFEWAAGGSTCSAPSTSTAS